MCSLDKKEYNVKVYLDKNQNLYFASYFFTGLSELSSQGKIDVDFLFPSKHYKFGTITLPWTVIIEVKNYIDNQVRVICIDFKDQSDIYAEEILKECDIYFKRNYYHSDLASISNNLRQKIQPFGMMYSCLSFKALARFFPIVARQDLSIFCDTLPDQRINNVYQNTRNLRLPFESHFINKPYTEVEPTILFQTRVWAPEESDDDFPEINERRVNTIRALKKVFKSQFIGGLFPSKFALEHYPDLVVNASFSRREYIAMRHRSLISISTRGLFNSIPFGVAESLAASNCIVSEPITRKLPVSLENGRHYLEFHSLDECIELCNRLLKDNRLAHSLRATGHKYYQEEVKPSVRMIKTLRRAFM